ncbi:MAG: FtsX-like permease family protein [Fastidiosipila sp.]|nr:FtsX-like permease family protein [Fastidiosipila sp.]
MIREQISNAWQMLRGNRARSFLTMLGIIVGIASVIAIVSVGEGATKGIIGQFDQVGASSLLVSVSSGQATEDDYITQEDVDMIRQTVRDLRFISVDFKMMAKTEDFGESTTVMIIGVDQDFLRISNLTITDGRQFSLPELERNVPSIIVEEESIKRFYPGEPPVGETLKLNRRGQLMDAEIVGVGYSLFSQLSATADAGANRPMIVYMPVTTAMQFSGDETNFQNILAMAESPERIEATGEQIIRLLEARHGNKGENIYQITETAQLMEQADTVANIFTSFIAVVAAISLLVGGIGVMNIMLVSVTERTREIGLRKALGATMNDIMWQFLIESVILTFTGGVIGIISGTLLGRILGYYIGFAPVLEIKTILIAVLFSSAIGLFFGLYPARKAAKLSPIDALRHE